MNRFIVISPNTESIQEAIRNHCPDHHHEILPGVWVVASTKKSPSAICKTLGIGGDDHSGEGVVFDLELSAYYGFYDPILWEKLNLWEDSDGSA